MPSGFTDRGKGKQFITSGSLQQFGSGSAASPGGGQIFNAQASTGLITSTGAGSTTEQTLASYVLPPNSLDRAGRNLLITAFGNFPGTGNQVRSAKLYFGSKSISIAASTTAGAAQSWMAQWNVFKSTSKAQVLMSQVVLSSLHGGMTFSTANEDDTVGTTIKLTGASTTPTGPGEVSLYSLQVEALN